MPASPAPGPRLPARRRTVPVVQQRGEQRRRRRTPLARWASASGACSWASSLASWACVAASASTTATCPVRDPDRQRVDERSRHPVRARAGVQAAEQHRPEHHVVAARHCRQHPRPHHVEHRRRRHPKQPVPPPATAVARAASTISGGLAAAAPSPCTSVRPNGAVGSVTSPSSSAKNRSCSSRGTPSRVWATKSRNGSGSGSRSASPGQHRPHLGEHQSSAVWSRTR